jgi:hypothetical protein
VIERTGVARNCDIVEMEVTVYLVFYIYENSEVFSAVNMTCDFLWDSDTF